MHLLEVIYVLLLLHIPTRSEQLFFLRGLVLPPAQQILHRACQSGAVLGGLGEGLLAGDLGWRRISRLWRVAFG